jgi:DNA repair exonuclease SbcCD ATPase subunit
VKNAAILLACLLGAVVVAGCGGGGGGGEPLSKEDYEQQMQALQEDLSASTNELQQAFSDPQDVDAMSEGLNDAAGLLDEASQSLDDIAPPEDVADAHQTMVDKSAAAAEKLREFADTVANASLAELQESLAEFQNIEEFTELQAAASEIEAKGYDIGGS